MTLERIAREIYGPSLTKTEKFLFAVGDLIDGMKGLGRFFWGCLKMLPCLIFIWLVISTVIIPALTR